MTMPSPTRRGLLAGAVGTVAATAGCSAFPGFSSPEVAGEWPTYQRDARNTGVEPAGEEPPTDLSSVWTHPVERQDIAAPAVGESLAFVPTTGRVSAVELDDGTERWTVEDTSVAIQPTLADSVVYVGTSDGVEAFHAATGKRAWTETESVSEVFSTPTIVSGTVVAGERRPLTSAGRVFAVGDPNWMTETRLTFVWSPTVADGVVYAGTWGQSGIQISEEEEARRHELVALSLADGGVEWRYDAVRDSVSAPAVAGGTVFVTTYDRRIHALDAATGEVAWTRDLPVVGASAPVVVGGTVYVGALDDRVYALSAADGTTRWRGAVGGRVIDGVAVAAADGDGDAAGGGGSGGSAGNGGGGASPPPSVVYAPTRAGTLDLLDAATGERIQTVDLGAAASTPPCVRGRTVLVGTDDEEAGIQRLHAFAA